MRERALNGGDDQKLIAASYYQKGLGALTEGEG